MCLTRLNTNYGPKYATKDIICYKVLCKDIFNEYYSPYQFFKYELNKQVSSNFSFTLSFAGVLSPQKEYDSLKIFKKFNCVRQGLHSYKYLLDAINFCKCFIEKAIVMECTIPKGSWYYEGLYNELVSNNIIINREI